MIYNEYLEKLCEKSDLTESEDLVIKYYRYSKLYNLDILDIYDGYDLQDPQITIKIIDILRAADIHNIITTYNGSYLINMLYNIITISNCTFLEIQGIDLEIEKNRFITDPGIIIEI